MIEVAAMETSAAFINGVFAHVDQAAESGSHAPTSPLDFTQPKEHVAQSTVWQYSGSLTTPSCDEGVAWNVVENPLFIDATTYRKVKSVLKYNSRFAQANPGENNLITDSCAAL